MKVTASFDQAHSVRVSHGLFQPCKEVLIKSTPASPTYRQGNGGQERVDNLLKSHSQQVPDLGFKPICHHPSPGP